MHAHRAIEYMQVYKKACDQNGQKLCEYLISSIQKAQKFSFESVPYQIIDERSEDGEKKTRVPQIEPNEVEWFKRGLIPLPAQCVWYETSIPHEKTYLGSHVGLLVQHYTEGVNVHLFLFPTTGPALVPMSVMYENFDPNKIKMMLYRLPIIGQFTDSMQKMSLSAIHVIFYLTLSVMLKSTVVEEVPAPKFLNKKRLSKNKAPIDSYRKVILISKEILKSVGPGSGEQKRLHYCRPHMRHFKEQTPNSQWVGDLEWNGVVGWWVTIIPGCWKGNPELGTVTHDYVVL